MSFFLFCFINLVCFVHKSQQDTSSALNTDSSDCNFCLSTFILSMCINKSV